MRDETIVPSDPLRLAHSYIYGSVRESREKKARDKFRDILKDYIASAGIEDENGNLCYVFDEPLYIEDDTYTGLQNQRRVSEYVNEDRAREVIERKGLESRCLIPVTIMEIDLDELYAANQEGLISDEEIDSVIDHEITYALVKMKD